MSLMSQIVNSLSIVGADTADEGVAESRIAHPRRNSLGRRRTGLHDVRVQQVSSAISSVFYSCCIGGGELTIEQERSSRTYNLPSDHHVGSTDDVVSNGATDSSCWQVRLIQATCNIASDQCSTASEYKASLNRIFDCGSYQHHQQHRSVETKARYIRTMASIATR